MITRVVRGKGGLHNRVTERLRLEPFSLADTEAYLRSRRVRLTRYDLLTLLDGPRRRPSLFARGAARAILRPTSSTRLVSPTPDSFTTNSTTSIVPSTIIQNAIWSW